MERLGEEWMLQEFHAIEKEVEMGVGPPTMHDKAKSYEEAF